jgi:hypothetical protein
MSRVSRLYWGCSVTIGASPRNCASNDAFWSCQPRKLLTPAYRILPARTASSKKPSVSSIGVSGSQAWAWYRSMVSTPSRRRLASRARDR